MRASLGGAEYCADALGGPCVYCADASGGPCVQPGGCTPAYADSRAIDIGPAAYVPVWSALAYSDWRVCGLRASQ